MKILSAGIIGSPAHAFDPLAYLAALFFFVAVVAMACGRPIFRAIHINPSAALQYE